MKSVGLCHDARIARVTSGLATPLDKLVASVSGPFIATASQPLRHVNAVTSPSPDEVPAFDDLGKGGGRRRRDARLVVEIVHSTSPAPVHHVLALLAEQKNRYYLVVSDRANADVTTHMQLHAVDGRARDPGGSPFACESGCARPRERRAAGARPDQERGRH